jgi:predicted metal-binding membrane protein
MATDSKGFSGIPRSVANIPSGLLLSVGVLSAFAWGYLIVLASSSTTMGSALAMPMSSEWSRGQALLMALMWTVMMVAMMLPTSVPMLAAYERALGSTHPSRRSLISAFAVGYLGVWVAFASAATGLQWVLHDRALTSGMGVLLDPWLVSGVLIVAGIYEFTPAKMTMLGSCRTPLGFLATEWRDGRSGAFLMGVAHGRSCFGCCWALMLLLFVLGVMNLLWVLALSGLVALEKLTQSVVVPRLVGGVLILSGVTVYLVST